MMNNSKTKDQKPVETVWNWWYRRSQLPAGRHNSRLGRLVFQPMVALAIAALLAFKFHRVVFAWIVAGIGLLILLTGMFLPRLYSVLEKIVNTLAGGIGQALTWLLLVPFYYLCFMPGRIMLALMKRDPLRRCWDPSRPTYWEKKNSFQDSSRLTRQY